MAQAKEELLNSPIINEIKESEESHFQAVRSLKAQLDEWNKPGKWPNDVPKELKNFTALLPTVIDFSIAVSSNLRITLNTDLDYIGAINEPSQDKRARCERAVQRFEIIKQFVDFITTRYQPALKAFSQSKEANTATGKSINQTLIKIIQRMPHYTEQIKRLFDTHESILSKEAKDSCNQILDYMKKSFGAPAAPTGYRFGDLSRYVLGMPRNSATSFFPVASSSSSSQVPAFPAPQVPVSPDPKVPVSSSSSSSSSSSASSTPPASAAPSTPVYPKTTDTEWEVIDNLEVEPDNMKKHPNNSPTAPNSPAPAASAPVSSQYKPGDLVIKPVIGAFLRIFSGKNTASPEKKEMQGKGPSAQ